MNRPVPNGPPTKGRGGAKGEPQQVTRDDRAAHTKRGQIGNAAVGKDRLPQKIAPRRSHARPISERAVAHQRSRMMANPKARAGSAVHSVGEISKSQGRGADRNLKPYFPKMGFCRGVEAQERWRKIPSSRLAVRGSAAKTE